VSTGGGNISLTRVTGDLRPSTGGGRIIRDGETVTFGGGFDHGTESVHTLTTRARTRSQAGTHTDVVSAHAQEAVSVSRAGVVHVSRGSGDISVAEAPNGAIVTTGGGSVAIGRAGRTVQATTGGGAVTIGPVAGSVTATTGGGEVQVRLEESSAAQHVNVTTGGGRVVIEIPRTFSGRVEIESGIPEDGSMPRITAPWDLTQETVDRGSRGGSNSRSVRAVGTVGNGNDVIKVTTGRGDVEIRFAR
jgi:hypothetical protein